MSDVAVAIVASTVLSAITLILQLYRDSRTRRWRQEDAKLGQVIQEKIDENTEISRVAFAEANHVNAKIAFIGDELRASVQGPMNEANEILKEVASRPVQPVAPIRYDDAKRILDQREQRPPGPPCRRKDDGRQAPPAGDTLEA